ncbi:MAG: M28 family peptidase [Vicinamibacterales bacterium]
MRLAVRPLALVAGAMACTAAGLAAAQAPAAFDSTRAYTHVREQVYVPGPAGTPANARTRAYITKVLAAAGYKAVEQAFETSTPVGRVKMANIVATLPGERPERIILASHFDTKPIDEFRFVGANDGGSGTGVLLELARVLKSKPRPRFTIEFLFFDGEEAWGEWTGTNHTYGGRRARLGPPGPTARSPRSRRSSCST